MSKGVFQKEPLKNEIIKGQEKIKDIKSSYLATPKNSDSILQEIKLKQQEQDEAEISKIRASLGLEQKEKDSNLQQYLQEYLNLKEGVVEKIKFLKVNDLSKNYKAQYEALNDERLGNIMIAVIPDDLWVKGRACSESHAGKQLILIIQSYYEKNPDKSAWMLHEFGHCQNCLNSESPEAYYESMQTFAFDDLKTEYSYPNNPVELFAFTKQFQYLKKQGKSKEDVLIMLSKTYEDKEDFLFFNRVLDSVYG